MPDIVAVSPVKSTALLTDDDRYTAVANRDRAADGLFVYAVRSTGVYCRPGCAARLALRCNIVFYPAFDAAEAAGYRPCKRCRPHAAVVVDGIDERLLIARRTIEESTASPRLAELAAAAGFSRFYFQRSFKAAFGMSPNAYAAAVRANRVRDELVSGAPVTAALYDAGYSSSSRFYDMARSFGMSPSAVRSGGNGIPIHAVVVETSLGAMLIAATERGVCAVLFGADDDTVRADLARRFPHAEFVAAPVGFDAWAAAIATYVEQPRGALDVPLDVIGTAFQQRVWRELQSIGAGSTATYAQIAARLGSPGGARAVARACASNPAAVAIPCHRVVMRDGRPGGYRWGTQRKRTLLDREAAAED